MHIVDPSLKYKKILVAISAVIFMVSLTQTAYNAGNDSEALGFMAFLLGWLDLQEAGVSWFANPLLFLAWIMLFSRLKFSVIAALCAIGFSLSFLCFDNIIINEGGQHGEIKTYGSGYWLWIASCCITFAGALTIYLRFEKH